MAHSSANTPQPSKPAGDAARKAGAASTEDGLRKTRENTNSREEVRQQTVDRQGHPK